MSSKFKGEVNRNDTIQLRGTGNPTGKVVAPNFTLTITPFAKMYINLYNATDTIYYHKKCEAGVPYSIPYPNSVLDFIYVRGGSLVQSLGDLSPMYLQTAELTPGAKLKVITLGNPTEGYSNDSLQNLEIGAGNKLLEELDIRNLSNLNTTTLPVSNIPSLKRVYAQGSNIAQAIFANNGLLEEAYLPETITRLELRNLYYLHTMSLESYNNLLYLVIDNCPNMNDFSLEVVNQAPDLRTARITDIDWTLDDTSVLQKLYSLIETTDSPEVTLTGKVYVPVIREKELNDYNAVWSNLEITYPSGGLIVQNPVTFVNEDGTVLDVQYVDYGESAVDPITRENNPIATPTKESTISENFTFAGWSGNYTQIFEATTITATYTSSTREYTISYYNPLSKKYPQTIVAPYGTNVPYEGDVPTYTTLETNYTYYLFTGWDKSGLVTGDKVINAEFDTCSYSSGYFDGKDLSELRPVEIYMMTKLYKAGVITLSNYVSAGDSITMSFGSDYNYDDVESVEVISESMTFDGTNYYDTGINLIDEDKDFVFAMDYSMSSDSSANGVLAQCFRTSGTHGFKLYYSSGVKLAWGSSSGSAIGEVDARDMLVLRHIKGEQGLHVYHSNLSGTDYSYVNYTVAKDCIGTASLIFGCKKADDGFYEDYGIGKVNWAKIWYSDIGDTACANLVSWTHEELNLQMGAFRMYSTSDESVTSMTFLASHLLDRAKPIMSSTGNTGGWASSSLNTFMNSRMYNAIDVQWRQLIKEVQITSTVGDNSTETSTSNCYLAVPALYPLTNDETYSIETSKDYEHISTKDELIRCYSDGTAGAYWTRSPYIGSSGKYFNYIDESGTVGRFITTTTEYGVLVELSI